MSIFGSFGQKCIYHVTAGVERLFFFQLLISYNLLKSIVEDAIVDLKIIFKFGLKASFFDTFY